MSESDLDGMAETEKTREVQKKAQLDLNSNSSHVALGT